MFTNKFSNNFLSAIGIILGVTIAATLAFNYDFQPKNLYVGIIAGGVMGFMFSQMLPNKDDKQGCKCGHSHDNLAKAWGNI